MTAWLALVLAPQAAAQQFRLDPVMIPWVFGDTPALADIGTDLRADLEQQLGATYLMVPLADAPGFTQYDASVYLDSCPSNQRIECGYVVGQRSGALWVVVGQLAAGAPGRAPEVLLSVVDVTQSREVLSFSSTVTPDNHRAIADGLSLVLDQVISGLANATDVRNTREMWELRQQAQVERERTAQEIAGVAEIDELARTIVPREERRRMREEDLTEIAEREGQTPWEQLGFGPKEYVRFRNGGGSVEDWRALRRGRFGTITLSAWGGLGAGAYRHTYDGRYVLDVSGATHEVVGSTAQQVLVGTAGSTFGADVGVGVHRMVDVTVGVATRGSGYEAIVYQETRGEPGTVPRPVTTFRSTFEWRVGALVSPLPTFPVRPIGTADLVVWSGAPVDHVLGLPPALGPLDRPSAVSLQVGPGVELPVGAVTLTSRLRFGLRLAGNASVVETTGDPTLLLQQPPDAKAGGAVGVDWVFGLSVPIGPLFGGSD